MTLLFFHFPNCVLQAADVYCIYPFTRYICIYIHTLTPTLHTFIEFQCNRSETSLILLNCSCSSISNLICVLNCLSCPCFLQSLSLVVFLSMRSSRDHSYEIIITYSIFIIVFCFFHDQRIHFLTPKC